jgi:hypothetical protein
MLLPTAIFNRPETQRYLPRCIIRCIAVCEAGPEYFHTTDWASIPRPCLARRTSIDRSQRIAIPYATFEGFRVTRIENNVVTKIDYSKYARVRAQTSGTPQVEAATVIDNRGIILYAHPRNKEATLIKEWPFLLIVAICGSW